MQLTSEINVSSHINFIPLIEYAALLSMVLSCLIYDIYQIL